MPKLAQIFGLAHFFHEAIESQALHEVSEKELLQKTSNTLNRLKLWVQVGKNLSNLSPH